MNKNLHHVSLDSSALREETRELRYAIEDLYAGAASEASDAHNDLRAVRARKRFVDAIESIRSIEELFSRMLAERNSEGSK